MGLASLAANVAVEAGATTGEAVLDGVKEAAATGENKVEDQEEDAEVANVEEDMNPASTEFSTGGDWNEWDSVNADSDPAAIAAAIQKKLDEKTAEMKATAEPDPCVIDYYKSG